MMSEMTEWYYSSDKRCFTSDMHKVPEKAENLTLEIGAQYNQDRNKNQKKETVKSLGSWLFQMPCSMGEW